MKLKVQVPMSLYSNDTVPVLMDAENNENNEYSLIEVEYKYMAVTHTTYCHEVTRLVCRV